MARKKFGFGQRWLRPIPYTMALRDVAHVERQALIFVALITIIGRGADSAGLIIAGSGAQTRDKRLVQTDLAAPRGGVSYCPLGPISGRRQR